LANAGPECIKRVRMKFEMRNGFAFLLISSRSLHVNAEANTYPRLVAVFRATTNVRVVHAVQTV
jgi:hypothetical protein